MHLYIYYLRIDKCLKIKWVIFKERFSMRKVVVFKLMCCAAHITTKGVIKHVIKRIFHDLLIVYDLIQLIVCFPSPRQCSGIEIYNS